MLLRIVHGVFLLLAIGAGFGAFAADVPPVAVQRRVLVMPALPAGSEVPMNLPQDGALEMPFVSGGPPGVAQRINDTVWREMLDGTPAPTLPGNTFTPPLDQLPQGTVSLQYSAQFIPAVKPRLLSLDFSGEGCGAYCEDFQRTHLFDLRDGHQVSLRDLLTAKGFSNVGKRVDTERKRAYRKQVRQLQAALKLMPGDDDAADRLALNQHCLKRVAAEPSTPEWMQSYSFKVNRRNELVLTIGRCSNHAMRALDDVGEIAVTIPAADLTPWLTPYGRSVVLRKGP